MSVVYLHIGTSPGFGGFGVDIFFVISGFIMTMLVDNGQSAKVFAISRLTRIIPIYWVITTCLLILVTLKPELFKDTTADIFQYVKSLLFIPYFNGHRGLLPLLAVGWTLNYEMFFYFCIWLSILFIRRFYVPLVIIFITCAFVWARIGEQGSVMSTFFGSAIVFEFVFGIAAFKLYKSFALKHVTAVVFALICIASYVFMAVSEVSNQYNYRLITYGIPSFLMVFSAVMLESRLKYNQLKAPYKILASIGDASYAIYLTHLFVVVGFTKIGFQKMGLINPYTPLGVVCILISSLLLGYFLYIKVDKPLHNYFKKLLLSSPSAPPNSLKALSK
jgi:peptidoglycan/LPS O-acetylase OafA/YrhL